MQNIQKKDYLYEQVTRYLAELIDANRGRPDFKLPTEEMLAKDFHLSRITVRKAFDTLTAAGLLVRCKGRGTFLSPEIDDAKLQPFFSGTKPGARKIGVILPSIRSEHICDILHGIHSYCRDANLDHLLFEYEITNQNAELETQAIRKMLQNGVDGFLIYPVDGATYNNSLIKLSFQNFPLVLIDRAMPGINFNLIASDNRNGFLSGIDCLVRNGHRKIAIFDAYPYRVPTIADRIAAYEEGLKRNHLLIDTRLEIFSEKHPELLSYEEEQQVYAEATERLRELILNEKISAVLCADISSSVLLQRLLNDLERQYISVKNHISVIYCDLTESAREFCCPTPTCIYQDSTRMGAEAIKLLLDLLEHKNASHRIVTIPCLFFNGNSVQRIS